MFKKTKNAIFRVEQKSHFLRYGKTDFFKFGFIYIDVKSNLQSKSVYINFDIVHRFELYQLKF